MKKLLSVLCIVGIVLAVSAPAMASGPSLFGSSLFLGQPTPPAPAGVTPKPVPEPAANAALFPCVKYKDLDEMAPCAVPKIVQVLDPCWKPPCCDPCSCCCPKPKPPCVSVRICVPKQCCDPCSCCCPKPEVKCSKDGKRVRFDYGKYAVDVRVKKGYIEVDYQD